MLSALLFCRVLPEKLHPLRNEFGLFGLPFALFLMVIRREFDPFQDRKTLALIAKVFGLEALPLLLDRFAVFLQLRQLCLHRMDLRQCRVDMLTLLRVNALLFELAKGGFHRGQDLKMMLDTLRAP